MTPAAAVFILARSSEDWIPSPRIPEPTAAGVHAKPANHDPDTHARDDLRPCHHCKGRGRVRGPQLCASCPDVTKPGKDRPPGWRQLRGARRQHGCAPCPECDGTGWAERQPGERPLDSYTLQPLLDPGELSDGPVRAMEAWELDAAIRKTARLLALADGRSDLEQFGWERVKQLYWSNGDYQWLERAQQALQAQQPMAWSTWRRFVVGHDDRDVHSDRIRERLDMTARWLADWIVREKRAHGQGTRIRVPRWLQPEEQAVAARTPLHRGRTDAHERRRDDRDAEMRAAFQAGVKVEDLQARFGLSRGQVYAIVNVRSSDAVASGPAA